jgi:glycerate kinase
MAIKVIIAPQEFKGALSALAAAEAIERGVKAALPEAETVLVPVADGGDGTLDALVEGSGGRVFRSVVTGPLGQPLEARWGVMGDGQTAVIEMALACGLALVPHQRRNPNITTTRGTGEIIAEALDRGFSRIVVGLGGSATNDGGAGMASALGARLLDAEGQTLPDGGAALARLAKVDVSKLNPKLADTTIIGATDVTNPLCGPTGASAVYGPQKGATAEMVVELEAALKNYGRVLRRDLGKDVAERPGAGAAGGLGAGLMAFAAAELLPGIDMVCDVVNFDAHLQGADLVITGEGRADRSTIFNKAPVGVARRALAEGVPTLLLAGSLGPGHRELYQHGIAAIACIADSPMSFRQSLGRTAELLEGAAERALRLMAVGTNVEAGR